jgi:hypothetical protein
LIDGTFEIKPRTFPSAAMTKVGAGPVGANIQLVLVGNLILYIRTGGTVLQNDVCTRASIILVHWIVTVFNGGRYNPVRRTIFQYIPFGDIEALIVFRNEHRFIFE